MVARHGRLASRCVSDTIGGDRAAMRACVHETRSSRRRTAPLATANRRRLTSKGGLPPRPGRGAEHETMERCPAEEPLAARSWVSRRRVAAAPRLPRSARRQLRGRALCQANAGRGGNDSANENTHYERWRHTSRAHALPAWPFRSRAPTRMGKEWEAAPSERRPLVTTQADQKRAAPFRGRYAKAQTPETMWQSCQAERVCQEDDAEIGAPSSRTMALIYKCARIKMNPELTSPTPLPEQPPSAGLPTRTVCCITCV